MRYVAFLAVLLFVAGCGNSHAGTTEIPESVEPTDRDIRVSALEERVASLEVNTEAQAVQIQLLFSELNLLKDS